MNWEKQGNPISSEERIKTLTSLPSTRERARSDAMVMQSEKHKLASHPFSRETGFIRRDFGIFGMVQNFLRGIIHPHTRETLCSSETNVFDRAAMMSKGVLILLSRILFNMLPSWLLLLSSATC